MQSIGWNKGCWIIAPDGNCYGRNGDLTTNSNSICADSVDSTQNPNPGGIWSLGKVIYFQFERFFHPHEYLSPLLAFPLMLYIFYISGTRVCTEINDNCATNAPWCKFLTNCKLNCQTIDLVTYSCPDKCRKCSGSQGKMINFKDTVKVNASKYLLA